MIVEITAPNGTQHRVMHKGGRWFGTENLAMHITYKEMRKSTIDWLMKHVEESESGSWDGYKWRRV